MSKFGSSITYKIVDLISIFNKYGQEYFETKRNEYLESQNEPKDSNLYKINVEKIKKLIEFIKNNIDSLTCENEMKMECYFNKNEPAFVNGEVNRKLFNFSYADKIYNFAQKNNLDMRMHTIVWYRHFPKQLLDYLDGKSYEEKRNLTLKFIRVYMEELHSRYPNCYCVDVINEMVADPDELNYLKEEGESLYEFDQDGIRIDNWYRFLGKNYYIEIYKIAREVFGDNTKLFYNDNNEGNKEKQRYYINIIQTIKRYELENGLKLLDGFGMQMHLWGDETAEQLKEIFDFYTRLGLEIQVTEFDISCHYNADHQEQLFYDFINIISNYDIKVFTMWGLNDELSWLSEFEPLIVDKNYDNKKFAENYLTHFSNKLKSNKKNLKL